MTLHELCTFHGRVKVKHRMTFAAMLVLDRVRAHWQRVTEMLLKPFPSAVLVIEAADNKVTVPHQGG